MCLLETVVEGHESVLKTLPHERHHQVVLCLALVAPPYHRCRLELSDTVNDPLVVTPAEGRVTDFALRLL